MWKNRIFYILFLSGIVIFFVDHSGWVSWFSLLVTLLLPAFSLVLSLPGIIGQKVSISTKLTCKRMEKNEITLAIKRKNRIFSSFCKFTVMNRDLMTYICTGERIIFAQGTKYKAEVSTDHCGMYEYELKKGRAYDFLGLFSFPVKLPEKVTVAVMPIPRSPKPSPDFLDFYAKGYQPKPGGGFSEIHEMREYQAGDSLRSIHWKLSAKTDKLMVREAQEPCRQEVLVTLALSENRDIMDATLDQLMWVSQKLLEQEISHRVWVVNTQRPELLNVSVSCDDELMGLIRSIMGTRITTGISNLAVKLPKADWQYHIDPYRKGDAHEDK